MARAKKGATKKAAPKKNNSSKKAADKKAADKKAADKNKGGLEEQNVSGGNSGTETNQQPPHHVQHSGVQPHIPQQAIHPNLVNQNEVDRRNKASNITDEAIQKAQKETYDSNVHLTAEEFNAKFRPATHSDFKLGQAFYTKETYGERVLAKPIALQNNTTLDASAFSQAIYNRNAYIKR